MQYLHKPDEILENVYNNTYTNTKVGLPGEGLQHGTGQLADGVKERADRYGVGGHQARGGRHPA